MFKLRIGYLISGIATGCILLFSFVWTLPDGKLHIVFCDVGQGDAAYIRFPDGRDMLVDGGPNDRVLACLGKHMPFWDRAIDIVAMTHPQKDHMQGLISVLERYSVAYFIRSDVDNTTEGYQKLLDVVKQKKVAVKFATRGERIRVGASSLSFVWPSEEQIAKGKQGVQLGYSSSETQGESRSTSAGSSRLRSNNNVLGSSIVGELNDYSLVFDLHYGTFDALFTGDADNHVNRQFVGSPLAPRSLGEVGQADDRVEVLKVPHHGSKTGMTAAFLDWVNPQLAVISVGKNSYGHPAGATLATLAARAIPVKRTDQDGDIEVVSDGKNWTVKTTRVVGTGGRR